MIVSERRTWHALGVCDCLLGPPLSRPSWSCSRCPLRRAVCLCLLFPVLPSPQSVHDRTLCPEVFRRLRWPARCPRGGHTQDSWKPAPSLYPQGPGRESLLQPASGVPVPSSPVLPVPGHAPPALVSARRRGQSGHGRRELLRPGSRRVRWPPLLLQGGTGQRGSGTGAPTDF